MPDLYRLKGVAPMEQEVLEPTDVNFPSSLNLLCPQVNAVHIICIDFCNLRHIFCGINVFEYI